MRFLPAMQTAKQAFHSSTDARKHHDPLGQSKGLDRPPTFALLPLLIPRSQSGCCVCSGFSSQLRNPRLRKPQYVIMGCQTACSAPALEEDFTSILGGGTQTCLLLERKMHSCLPKTALYEHP